MPNMTSNGELFDITLDYDVPGLLLDNDKLLVLFKGCRVLNEQQPFVFFKWKQVVATPTNFKLDIIFSDLSEYHTTLDLTPGAPTKMVSTSIVVSIKMSSLAQIRVLRDHLIRFHEDFFVTKLNVITVS